MAGPTGGQSAATEVHVEQESLAFSAAHFSIIGGGRERLHGHNYRVALRAVGGVGSEGTIVDFAALKRAVRAECAGLDHRMLVPTRSPEVAVSAQGGEVTLHVRGERFVFPADDVVLLEVRNTTCECLAAHLLQRVRARLGDVDARLEVRVDETPGQGATCTETAGP